MPSLQTNFSTTHINVIAFLFYLFRSLIFWNRVLLCGPGWSRLNYLVQANLKHIILLLQPPNCGGLLTCTTTIGFLFYLLKSVFLTNHYIANHSLYFSVSSAISPKVSPSLAIFILGPLGVLPTILWINKFSVFMIMS